MSGLTPSEIADKLDEARALIEKGWIQDHACLDANGRVAWYSEAVCFCSHGAARAVFATDFDLEWSASDVALHYLNTVAEDDGFVGIVEWNDAPERTQAEVVEAFRKAADLARAEVSA